jgi:hypothetical protein
MPQSCCPCVGDIGKTTSAVGLFLKKEGCTAAP